MKLSSTLIELSPGRLAYWCPGCDTAHSISVGAPERGTWHWDGDVDKPTFAPSVRTVGGGTVCHCFVRKGVIEFLQDCNHKLAGQNIAIPAWPL